MALTLMGKCIGRTALDNRCLPQTYFKFLQIRPYFTLPARNHRTYHPEGLWIISQKYGLYVILLVVQYVKVDVVDVIVAGVSELLQSVQTRLRGN